jgi:hypothetical protein
LKGIFKYGGALLGAVHGPLLDTDSVSVKNFAQHCHFKIEPTCVNHPYCIFYKIRGFGLDGSQYGINNSFIFSVRFGWAPCAWYIDVALNLPERLPNVGKA